MNDILLVIVSICSSLIESSELNVTKICENKIGNITCGNPRTVSITYAIYGRNDNTTCPDKSLINYRKPCGSNQTDYFQSHCQMKMACSITPTNDRGDPCLNIYKYLTVRFYCSAPLPTSTNGTARPISSSTITSKTTSFSIISSEISTFSNTKQSSPNSLETDSSSSVPKTKQEDSNLAGLIGGSVAAVVCIVIVVVIVLIHRRWPQVINCKKNKNTTKNDLSDFEGNVSYIQSTQESVSSIPANSSLQAKFEIRNLKEIRTNKQPYCYASMNPEESRQTQLGKTPYDYADLSNKNGNSQSKSASKLSNVYHVLDPNETGFDRHKNYKTFEYDLAKPASNISETEVYMTSNDGVYDRAQERRHKLLEDENNVYSHGTDNVYDCAHDREHKVQEDVNNLYGHMVDGVYDSASHCRQSNDNGVDYGIIQQ